MTLDFWLSIGIGAALGVAYGGTGYLTFRRALKAPQHQFMLLVWGGLMARMFIALAVITLIVVLVPVRLDAFIGAFFSVFIVAMIAEVLMLHRHGATPPPAA